MTKGTLGGLFTVSLALGAASAPAALVILNVMSARTGRLPDGWMLKANRGTPDVTAIDEPNGKVIRLKSHKSSFALERSVDVDLNKLPYLTWSWKVSELPPGGDFRHAATDDQAAQVLVAFTDRRVLSYLWDSTAPKGLRENASAIPFLHIWAIVCRSGASEMNQWLPEAHNIAEDFKKAYNRPPTRVKGIRLQINTQHTGTSAESYFGEISFRDAPSMQVLVTGATGFIGSHLVERLLAEGAAVRCLIRPFSPRGGGQRHLPPSGVRPVLGDLVTGGGLEDALDGVDVVYHLAGVTKALSVRDYYVGNLTATQSLLRACAAQRMRLVHVSSLAAAGPSPNGAPLREDAPPRPLTHYGKSKLQGEQAVRSSAQADRAVILRPPVVYGPRDTDVFTIFRGIASGLMMRIGSGESYFSYIYVADLVDALLLAGSAASAGGRTFYVSSPQAASWSEFAAIAAAVMLRKPKTLRVPSWVAWLAGAAAELAAQARGRAGLLSREKIVEARQRYWICDASAAEAGLGFRAQTGLREGVAATLEWYRNEHWLTY